MKELRAATSGPLTGPEGDLYLRMGPLADTVRARANQREAEGLTGRAWISIPISRVSLLKTQSPASLYTQI